MASGAGFLGYLGMTFQTSGTGWDNTAFGAVGSAHWIPFVSESVTQSIPRIESGEIRYAPDEPFTEPGLRTVAGDIVFEPTPYTLSLFGFAALGALVGTTSGSLRNRYLTPIASNLAAFSPVPLFTLVIGRDVGCAVQIKNCVVNQLTLEIAQGDILKATASILGGHQQGFAEQTPSFSDVYSAHLPWETASIQLAGAAAGDIISLNMSIANNLSARPVIDGTPYAAVYKRDNFRQIRVNGNLELATLDHYNRLVNGTELVFDLNFAHNNQAARMSVPKLVYEAAPFNVGGPGPLGASFTGRAHPEPTSGAMRMMNLTAVTLQVGSTFGT